MLSIRTVLRSFLCRLGYHRWSEWQENSRFCNDCKISEIVGMFEGYYWDCPYYKEKERKDVKA